MKTFLSYISIVIIILISACVDDDKDQKLAEIQKELINIEKQINEKKFELDRAHKKQGVVSRIISDSNEVKKLKGEIDILEKQSENIRERIEEIKSKNSDSNLWKQTWFQFFVWIAAIFLLYIIVVIIFKPGVLSALFEGWLDI